MTSPRIRSQNNLQLLYKSSKKEQYGGTQKGKSTELQQEAFKQSGLGFDSESTAFNFMDKDILRNS